MEKEKTVYERFQEISQGLHNDPSYGMQTAAAMLVIAEELHQINTTLSNRLERTNLQLDALYHVLERMP